MDDKVWDRRRLHIATEAGGVALWSWHVDSNRITMDELAFKIWGLPTKDYVTFEDLSACVVPEDLDLVREAFNATRDISGAYEIDFRILHGDELRWVSSRGRGDDQGMIDRVMYGVFLDVTFRKRAEEDREMITGEMHHRIKNLFSLSSALAMIASRGSDSKEEMLDDLTRRLRGLAAAHDLIYPGLQTEQKPVNLAELLKVLLGAYTLDTSASENVRISAPDIMVGERAITSLAMIIYELATNSAKFGALSAETGKLELYCRDNDDEIELVWKETGGPAPRASNRQAGFGSLLTDRVVKQVKGTIVRDWTESGLNVTLRMSEAQLGA